MGQNIDMWVLKINDKEEYHFMNFNVAAECFRSYLANYLISHSHNSQVTDEPILFARSAVPMDIMVHFGQLYDAAKITDEEILIETRLSMLMESLLSKDIKRAKYRAMDVITMEFDYKYNHPEEAEVIIESTCSPKEITIDLKSNDCFLQTNAFLIEDDNLDYYFKSSIVCCASNNDEDLGKRVEYTIKLEPVLND